MKHGEHITKLIIEAILPAKLEYRVEQSHGEYDFDVRYRDGTVAALEATASVDEAEVGMLAAIKRQTSGTAAFPVKKCQHSWMIFARPTARVTTLRKKLDICLSKLELDGVDRFSPSDLRLSDVNAICSDLEVTGGCVIPTSHPARLYLVPAGSGEFVSATGAIEASRREVFKKDNRLKLGASNAPERHLAVYIDVSDSSAWTALNWTDPPTVCPRLPPEITHIWMFAETALPKDFIVWHGTSDKIWQSRRLHFSDE